MESLKNEINFKIIRPCKENSYQLKDFIIKNIKETDEFYIATAFVSDEMVNDFVKSAIKKGKIVKFLTGTYGNFTRKKVFRDLLDLKNKNKNFEAHIWNVDKNSDFHMKLYLWRNKNSCIAWIGSANFTLNGFENEGEIIIEIKGDVNSDPLKKLIDVFNYEFNERSEPISLKFVNDYKEIPIKNLHPDIRKSLDLDKAFIFTWNPIIWKKNKKLKYFQDGWKGDYKNYVRDGRVLMNWSCGNLKDSSKIPEGSLAFLIKVGTKENRGIIAIGKIKGKIYLDSHWDESKSEQECPYIDIEVEKMSEDPNVPLLDLEELKEKWSNVRWYFQKSASPISNEIAEEVYDYIIKKK